MIQNIVCKKRKTANKIFCQLLGEKLKEFGVENSEQVIKFLIKYNIIRQTIVHRFVVLNIYPDYLERYGKQKAVGEMSKILPLESSSIYSILSNHSSYFRPNKIDF